MKKFKVTVLKKEVTPAYRDDKGRLVPYKEEIVVDNDAAPRNVQVGETKVEVKPGKVQELPDEVANYLDRHRFYKVEEVGGKAE